MRKIVFVIDQLFNGGAERVTAALMNEFCRDEKNEIHLVVYNRDEKNEYSLNEKVQWHVLPYRKEGRIKSIWSRFCFLKSTIKRISPNCVISLGIPRITVPLTFAMLGNSTPLILSERNDPQKFPTNKVWRILRNISYYFADGVVFQTEEAKACFGETIAKKSVVICNPITDNLPERYIGEREPKIVNYCRLSPQKNLDLLIDAFVDIADLFPEYSLHIYGEGPEQAHLEKKIWDLNLAGRVFLHGYSNQIYEEIKNASLFVSSSDYEGISNSMLEAIALGVPSICTDCPVGGARMIIENGINGFLVPVRNRNALAETMKNVLSDRRLSESMSVAGYELRNKISAENISGEWMEYINRLMD